ncbi:MAG: Coenzyme F420 hydrogenase/dehydrogenase, beta subunit C-terminal domain [Succinivibrionaceae bacterium]|nr:Coenzyme F420 hydrogenase/dehydrogenase, beta subunit C-terminal domain [Succinivibrionaceae bacterium]
MMEKAVPEAESRQDKGDQDPENREIRESHDGAWSRRLETCDARRLPVTAVVPEGCCSGCGACVCCCPTLALNFSRDRFGYHVPAVEPEKCRLCGKCQKICPALNLPVKKHDPKPELYAFAASDGQLLERSSSGGAFGLLAAEVINQGGAVAGCAWDADTLGAKHVLVRTSRELLALHKSKYFQSFSGNILKEVREELKKGTAVLFVGCPCQVAGLRAYIGYEPENLIAIDLLCGNSPSGEFFQRYLDENFSPRPVSYEFRSKIAGKWHTHSCRVEFADGTAKNLARSGDDFQRAYHPHLMIPLHCERCRYQSLPRYGDLTIGDFWGIGAKEPDLDLSRGVSAVLVNSRKGRELFQRIPKESVAYCARKHLEWLGGNGSALPGKRNWASVGRDAFYRVIGQEPFSRALAAALALARGKNHQQIMGRILTSVDGSNAIFSFDPACWEAHRILGIWHLFSLTARKRRYAVLPFGENLVPGRIYALKAVFRIASDSPVLHLHVYHRDSGRIKAVHRAKVTAENRQRCVTALFKFEADDVYDSFAIGASQISGNLGYVAFEELVLGEYRDYLH